MIRTRCGLDFWGLSVTTSLMYVTFRSDGTWLCAMKNIVLVPGILVVPEQRRWNSSEHDTIHTGPSRLRHSFLYSSNSPVSALMAFIAYPFGMCCADAECCSDEVWHSLRKAERINLGMV